MFIFDVKPETYMYEIINTKYLPQCIDARYSYKKK